MMVSKYERLKDERRLDEMSESDDVDWSEWSDSSSGWGSSSDDGNNSEDDPSLAGQIFVVAGENIFRAQGP